MELKDFLTVGKNKVATALGLPCWVARLSSSELVCTVEPELCRSALDKVAKSELLALCLHPLRWHQRLCALAVSDKNLFFWVTSKQLCQEI